MKHIEIAISQLDLQEEPRGSNWGPHVKKYLNSVGINFPAAWCMAYVYWCCKEAYSSVGKLKKTGGVMAQWNQTPKERKSSKPEAGDIFIMDFGKGLGHTGFVESVDGEWLNTIEGNTTTVTGSREGYEVCRRKRKVSTMKGFIKVIP